MFSHLMLVGLSARFTDTRSPLNLGRPLLKILSMESKPKHNSSRSASILRAGSFRKFQCSRIARCVAWLLKITMAAPVLAAASTNDRWPSFWVTSSTCFLTSPTCASETSSLLSMEACFLSNFRRSRRSRMTSVQSLHIITFTTCTSRLPPRGDPPSAGRSRWGLPDSGEAGAPTAGTGELARARARASAAYLLSKPRLTKNTSTSVSVASLGRPLTSTA
mmetsp:Transcript_53952/g.153886  ORF Transcript_53952/g.153886 Transcript_53952/m.153886 type:complete len:220 (-) Transcript_53952:539-1198(-)